MIEFIQSIEMLEERSSQYRKQAISSLIEELEGLDVNGEIAKAIKRNLYELFLNVF